jgi:hypothetical protein
MRSDAYEMRARHAHDQSYRCNISIPSSTERFTGPPRPNASRPVSPRVVMSRWALFALCSPSVHIVMLFRRICNILKHRIPSSISIAMDYELHGRSSVPDRCKEFFIYSTESRPDFRPTQPHIQWNRGFSLGIKRPGSEADYSLPSTTNHRIIPPAPYAFNVWFLIN